MTIFKEGSGGFTRSWRPTDYDGNPLPDTTEVFRCGHPRTVENTKPGYGGRTPQCRLCHRHARALCESKLEQRDAKARRAGRGAWSGRRVFNLRKSHLELAQWKFQTAPTRELQARRVATADRLFERADRLDAAQKAAVVARQDQYIDALYDAGVARIRERAAMRSA